MYRHVVGTILYVRLNLQAVVYDREQRGNVPSAKRRKAAAEAKARNEGVGAWRLCIIQ